MHAAVMTPCDQTQNMLHHNIVEPGSIARKSKILHDVTTALPNIRFEWSGILRLMIPTSKGACYEDVQFRVTDDTDCGTTNPT